MYLKLKTEFLPNKKENLVHKNNTPFTQLSGRKTSASLSLEPFRVLPSILGKEAQAWASQTLALSYDILAN